MSTTRFEIKTCHGCFIWMYLWRKPTVFRKVSMAFSFYLIKLLSWAEQLRLQPSPGKPLVTALTAPPTGRESDWETRHFVPLYVHTCSRMTIKLDLTYTLFHLKAWSQFNVLFIFLGKKLSKLILLFSKNALNWSKVMIKTFIMLQIISISDKCCSSELSIHQRNLKKFYSAVFNIIINVFLSSKSEY